jgi:hypothetical protein
MVHILQVHPSFFAFRASTLRVRRGGFRRTMVRIPFSSVAEVRSATNAAGMSTTRRKVPYSRSSR